MGDTHGVSVITGGAGFIGSNLACRLLGQGRQIRILDNLSRPGAARNLQWLRQQFGDRLQFIHGDIRNIEHVERAMEGVDVVYHLAAQVAVTTSVVSPRMDFEVNALGTLNILEAARRVKHPPVVLYASTNKVYGEMTSLRVGERGSRYVYQGGMRGVGEDQPLDFHSPYGCSKGAADQYVRDYARLYGLRTIVCRMSCIYGPRQFGNEDQGWVAHFVISACLNRPITIYGDGKQVRDALFVEDLLDAYQRAVAKAEMVKGQVFNLGGGPRHTLSLLGLVSLLERRLQRPLTCRFEGWRPGDQRVYISQIQKAERVLQWKPTVTVEAGVNRLLDWVMTHQDLFFEEAHPPKSGKRQASLMSSSV